MLLSLSVAVFVGACSSQPPAPAKTVTQTVTIAPSGSPPADTTNGAAAVGIGQEARDGAFVFTVTEVRPLSGDMAGKGVAVLFTVKNVGNSSQTYFATDQKLMDDQGRQFSVDTDAMVSGPMTESSRQLTVLWTAINPGIQVDLATIFAMPEGAKPALMVLHESARSSGVTVNVA
ncbi:MAG: DUF4352 domain-containing protein [Mycobacteriaceae bacterium]|nr:DUF4352 domain-containing protein [Mycobacteriaceae bacterium]MBV9639893.1 DUF4352 domain-containing protein [Mycobacteriaceae bacterium]